LAVGCYDECSDEPVRQVLTYFGNVIGRSPYYQVEADDVLGLAEGVHAKGKRQWRFAVAHGALCIGCIPINLIAMFQIRGMA
jgi:hypothetical protein